MQTVLVHQMISALLTQIAGHKIMINVAGLDAMPIDHICLAESGEDEIHLMSSNPWIVDEKGNRICPVPPATSLSDFKSLQN